MDTAVAIFAVGSYLEGLKRKEVEDEFRKRKAEVEYDKPADKMSDEEVQEMLNQLKKHEIAATEDKKKAMKYSPATGKFFFAILTFFISGGVLEILGILSV